MLSTSFFLFLRNTFVCTRANQTFQLVSENPADVYTLATADPYDSYLGCVYQIQVSPSLSFFMNDNDLLTAVQCLSTIDTTVV
jgi:hypothetical protein